MAWLIVFQASVVLAGQSYFVAPGGDDAANGLSTNAPWRTIQHALNRSGASDTIFVRGGIYTQRVSFVSSGSPSVAGRLRLTAYRGERPVIDGSGLTVQSGMDALVTINSKHDIEFSGFEIRNFSTVAKDHVPLGIYVSGASCDLVLTNLVIHGIENRYDPGGDAVLGADAHGLAIYGDDASSSISNVVIDGVEIYNCLLGSSEALVLNGNVDGFRVSGCRVHDNNNIGIVFIGHEGVCANAAFDQARNGVCFENLVYNIRTVGNPAYRSGSGYDRSADGIYVDGGRDIVIERNRVHDCDICLEVASEHGGKSTSGITVRNNLLVNGYSGGIYCGGYDFGRGSAIDCKFIGNTLYHNNTAKDYSGEITLQYHITNTLFRNNLIVALANQGGDAVYFSGPGGSNSQPSATDIDYNLYFSDESDSPSWRFGDSEYYSWHDWQQAGHDAHGLYGENPLLKAPVNGAYCPREKSPAIDRGETRGDIGVSDLDGRSRQSGSGVDIGACEFQKSTGMYLIGR